MECQVYWIKNSTCLDVLQHGYVGVSKSARERFKSHKRKKRVPKDSELEILFEGSRENCFRFERELRPHHGIGWNNAIGGSQGWRIGFNHTPESRSKMRQAWDDDRKKRASELRKSLNASLRGKKRPSQSLAMMGSNNPNYGKKRPPHVIEAMKMAHIGVAPPNKQENYCVGCHKRDNLTNIRKYHTKCRNNFYQR